MHRLKEVHGNARVVGKNLCDKVADGVAFFVRDSAETVVAIRGRWSSAARIHGRIV
jgi:hypothetical protein